MPDGTIQIPDQINFIVGLVLWVFIATVFIWLVASGLGYLHRRGYNLTRAEAGGGPGITPDFLKVDRAKRAEAIDKGSAFGGQDKAGETISTVSKYSRIASLGAAILSLVTVTFTALLRIESVQNVFDQLTTWDRLVTIVQQNTVGVAAAVAVILFNVGSFIQAVRGKKA